jgi:hypothetical protein
MFIPLVVLDVYEKVINNSDYVITEVSDHRFWSFDDRHRSRYGGERKECVHI